MLLPLAKSQADFDAYLKAGDSGAFGTLLPRDVYEGATGKTPDGPLHPGQDPGLRWVDLRLVAFRVDPCFAHLGPITDPSTCKNQLRVVFQSMQFASDQTTIVDGAVHVFYELPRDELVTMVKELVALRRANETTGPLAVSRIVSRQGLTGAMQKGYAKIITEHAGASRVVRFTRFTPANLATVWNFSGFDVASGKFTSMDIPTLPKDATGVKYFKGFAADLEGGFDPPTSSKDSMQLLGNATDAKKATKAAQQAAYDAALKIENPTFHTPDTIDCASCHVAEPARVATGEKLLGLSADGNPNAFQPDGKYVKASEMKVTTPVDLSDGLNLHAFSYRDDKPMINTRVVNESAAIVAYLQGNVLTK